VAGNCGLQFTDNLGTAVAKGFDLQAQMQFGPVHLDLATGYTSARFTKDAPSGCQTQVAAGCRGSRASRATATPSPARKVSTMAPGASPPWTVALGAEYAFKLGQRDAFVRADWEYQSRQ